MAFDDEPDFAQQQPAPTAGVPHSATEDSRVRPPLLDRYTDEEGTNHAEHHGSSTGLPTTGSVANADPSTDFRPDVVTAPGAQSGSGPSSYPPVPVAPPSGPEPSAQREAERGRTASPSPEAIEAVGQAATLQRALINLGEMIGTKYVFEQTLDADAPIDAEYLAVIRRVYAKPRSEDADRLRSPFAQALATLRPSGSVLVINRPPNSSRTTTGYALLDQLVEEGLISEVRPLSFGGSQHFPARRLPHDRRCGFLLELPPDEDGFQVADTFGSGLGKLGERLARRDNRLIVLTRPEQWRRISHGAAPSAAPDLGEIHPHDIATRWLLAQEPSFPVSAWLGSAGIRRLIGGMTPTDILNVTPLMLDEHRKAERLAADDLSDVARDSAQQVYAERRRSLDEQIANVVAVLSNWEDALYEWHEPEDRVRTSFERNFLLTAAVLRGDPVGHVYAKAAELTDTLDKRDTPVPVHGQQAPGVIAMTKAIKARREEDGTLRFDRPHWDDAAIEYFWNDRPLARTSFLKWLAQVPIDDTGTNKEALETITKDARRALAGRIGEFALRWAVRHRRQEPLEAIVTAWYAHGTDKELWPLAVTLLDNAAIHAASAPYVHSLLLSWAKRKDPSLQQAVVEVCTGQFGRRHTGKALRRLKRVANSGLPEVVDSLREAIQVLWADTSVRKTLFGYVVDWCGDEKIRDTVGHRTFTALAASSAPEADRVPLVLHSDTTPDADEEEDFRPPVAGLVTGWRTLLRQATGAAGDRELDRAIFLWLDAALERPPLRPIILDTLRRAVDVRGPEGPTLREALRTCSQVWVQSEDRPYSPDRANLKLELSSLLDADLAKVQQLLLQEHPEADTSEEREAA
ncbi:hypothetical protein [Streptomyces sp. GbtcB7]|uniref:hypothetical protein n=1 Tax=Streptomyces sp. GbtcB7 TaxID=2824752 RepID=UPI0020C6D049|nr:hypothetical protein [Streptomyces sp. GbtcB7]